MGRLTTHVLDTALGKPANGLKIDLWLYGETPVFVSSHVTNADGRVWMARSWTAMLSGQVHMSSGFMQVTI